jgi:drug/metabolite transporter (DMT)-like permease
MSDGPGAATTPNAGSRSSPHASARYGLAGAIFVMVAAALFAIKGLFAKALYARAVHYDTVVTVRALVALPLFVAFAHMRDGGLTRIVRARPKALLVAALAGFLCYCIGALTDFYALTLIHASIERVLIFSYPAMVVVISSAMTRTWPSRSVVLGTALTYVGIFFAIGGIDIEMLRANWVGATWVLVSALTYAVYYIISERYTRELGSSLYTLAAMGAAGLALAVYWSARHDLAELAALHPYDWLMLLLVGTVSYFVPASLQAEGVRRIGAQRGAVLSTVGPPTTIFFAWLLFEERMTAWQVLGVALIVGGILALDIARTSRRA